MRKFDEIKANFPAVPYAKRSDFTKFYGYSAGKVIGTFNSIEEAKKAGATTTERTFDREGYNMVHQKFIENETAIVNKWSDELRADYPKMSDEMFSAIYAAAYERGHSCGYDEVALHFDDYYDFAMKVIEINKKE